MRPIPLDRLEQVHSTDRIIRPKHRETCHGAAAGAEADGVASGVEAVEVVIVAGQVEGRTDGGETVTRKSAQHVLVSRSERESEGENEKENARHQPGEVPTPNCYLVLRNALQRLGLHTDLSLGKLRDVGR